MAAARLADTIPNGSGVLTAFVIASLMSALISLFITLPLIVATLGTRRLGLALLGTLSLDATVMVGLVLVLSKFEPTVPGAYVFIASMAVGFFVCVTGVMLMVRRFGYRLVWVRTNVQALAE